MEAHALDEVVEILEQLLGELFTEAAKADQKVRLRHLRDLDGVTSTLAQVCSWLLEDSLSSETGALRGKGRCSRGDLQPHSTRTIGPCD